MRDYTNLAWPEGPFGADQRPFGKPAHILAAITVEWADRPDAEPLPTAVATVLDRALVRARRHAQTLAGHDLGVDLAGMTGHSPSRLPGVIGVHLAWSARSIRERGIALMVDTNQETGAQRGDLDTTLIPVPVPMPDISACCSALARDAVTRCLAVGLAAARHTGRYRWEGTFNVHDSIEQAGWDVFGNSAGHGAPPKDYTPVASHPR